MSTSQTGDKIIQAGRVIEELILALLEGHQARENLSFKYVCPEGSDGPGWYFWPKKKAGVYYIQIQRADGDSEEIKAVLNLYYYPHPQEKEFLGFSCLEQFVRISEVFYEAEKRNKCGEDAKLNNMEEGKGIPLPPYRGGVQPWLYRIGDMVLFIYGGRITKGVLEAPGLSQSWSITDVKTSDKNGDEYTILERRGLDRCLQSWDLACFFCQGFLEDLTNLPAAYSSWMEKKDGLNGMQKLCFAIDYDVRLTGGI